MNATTLVDGRGLLESPRWHDDRIYFSDWSSGEVIAVDPATAATEAVARVASLPLCTAFLPDGRLLVVDSPRGLLLEHDARPPADGGLVTYADLGRPGWNDTAVDRYGNVYVNRV